MGWAGATQQVTRRNATFQQWQTLLTNRTKRGRAGEFVVQGVRAITLAIEHDWPVRAVLTPLGGVRSRWAQECLDAVGRGARHCARFAVDPDLIGELAEKEDAAPELVLVVAMPDDDLERLPMGPGTTTVVFDRPTNPGNIGAIIRSMDAFGADGLIVTGHAADPYDPRSVRASTGSLFALPVVRCDSHVPVLAWVGQRRAAGEQVTIWGTDEDGDVSLPRAELTVGSAVLVIGNETRGMSTGWQAACDRVLSIPMSDGSASSLNASNAAAVVLYETQRQRLGG